MITEKSVPGSIDNQKFEKFPSAVPEEQPEESDQKKKSSVVKKTIRLVKSHSIAIGKKREQPKEKLECLDSNNNSVVKTQSKETEVETLEGKQDLSLNETSNDSKNQVKQRLSKFIRSLGQSRKASYELVNIESHRQNIIESSGVGEPLRNRHSWWSLRAPKINRNDSKRQRKLLAVVPDDHSENQAENICLRYRDSNNF